MLKCAEVGQVGASQIRQALWHTVVLGRLLEVVVYVSHTGISVMGFRQLVKGKHLFGNSFGCSSPWPLTLSFHSITRYCIITICKSLGKPLASWLEPKTEWKKGHGLTDRFSHAPVTKTTTAVLCLKVPTLFLESFVLKTKSLVFSKARVLVGQSKLGHSMIPSRWLLKTLNDGVAKVNLEGVNSRKEAAAVGCGSLCSLCPEYGVKKMSLRKKWRTQHERALWLLGSRK